MIIGFFHSLAVTALTRNAALPEELPLLLALPLFELLLEIALHSF